MKPRPVRWMAGEPVLQALVERALAEGPEPASLLQRTKHRSVHHIVLSAGSDRAPGAHDVVVKIFHTATGRHPIRERVKSWLRRSPARREWRALEALHAAGVPVPLPRAWGRLGDRDEVVVADFLEGEALAIRFERTSESERRALLDGLAATIGTIHEAGYRHGDLHIGHCWATSSGIAMLDVQRARPLRGPRDRLLDLARLELSTSKAGWTSATRMALRDRLGLNESFDPVLRRFLRDHLRGRARRVLRVGRNWSRARVGRQRGLRDHDLDEETLASLIESSAGQPDSSDFPETEGRRGGRVHIFEARAGSRRVLVKSIAAAGLRRAIGDRLRGSPAARAFKRGQRIRLLSTSVARPLAYLEDRRFGLPMQIWLVVEKVGDADLDQIRPSSPEAQRNTASALGEWLADTHAWGLSHRDLKGANLRIAMRSDEIEFWMIDLEDLGGPAKVSDEARLHALAQLNASLDDEAFEIKARLAGLDSYTRRFPFASGSGARVAPGDAGDHNVTRKVPINVTKDISNFADIAANIARRSLQRAHRWRGDGCECLELERRPERD